MKKFNLIFRSVSKEEAIKIIDNYYGSVIWLKLENGDSITYPIDENPTEITIIPISTRNNRYNEINVKKKGQK